MIESLARRMMTLDDTNALDYLPAHEQDLCACDTAHSPRVSRTEDADSSRREIVRLDNVSLRRDNRGILCDINLTIEDGERWVVLGRNGSGKTSLVQLLSTYQAASSGTVTILGREFGRVDVRDLRPCIGYLSPALGPLTRRHLTPTQIVDSAQQGALVPWYIDVGAVRPERTRAALEAVGALEVSNRPYAELSSGVQLARALVGDPALLLLDEPMANLDIGARERLIAALTEIGAGTIRAIVMVVHRVEDIPSGFTHVLMMQDGRSLAAGPIHDVMNAEALSACFAFSLDVRRIGGRYVAVAT